VFIIKQAADQEFIDHRLAETRTRLPDTRLNSRLVNNVL